MTINQGARFSHYEILAPLGAGGMGEVYRARDSRLDHEVAIKVLPADFANDKDRLLRFVQLAWVYQSARQYDRALEQGRKTYELEPSFLTARWNFSQAYMVKGMYAEATALSEKTLEAYPTNQFMLQAAGYAYAKSGRRREAEGIIERFKNIAKSQYVMSYWAASIYAALSDKDKAFAELENAFAGRDWYLHRLKVDPFWDSLHDDPRFKQMLKRLNLPE
jgi:tetratricopeptide (TPR) repeat protein